MFRRLKCGTISLLMSKQTRRGIHAKSVAGASICGSCTLQECNLISWRFISKTLETWRIINYWHPVFSGTCYLCKCSDINFSLVNCSINELLGVTAFNRQTSDCIVECTHVIFISINYLVQTILQFFNNLSLNV